MWRHSVELRSLPRYSRTRAEYVNTCIRHNDRLDMERYLSAFGDAVMGHFVDHLSRDVKPKGCDVTVLNFVRCRDTREPVPNTWKPVYVTMIDWICAINRVATSGDKTAYALLWERWLLSNLSLLYLWAGLSQKWWTIGGQYLLYRLYYLLCVSRWIDTWQIVYLSYKEPCPTISNHKRYIHVKWVHIWPVGYPFNGQMRTGTGPALVLLNIDNVLAFWFLNWCYVILQWSICNCIPTLFLYTVQRIKLGEHVSLQWWYKCILKRNKR